MSLSDLNWRISLFPISLSIMSSLNVNASEFVPSWGPTADEEGGGGGDKKEQNNTGEKIRGNGGKYYPNCER
jgi:hypothetical protein